MSENGDRTVRIILSIVLSLVTTAIILFLAWSGSTVFEMNGRQENILAVQKTQAETTMRLIEAYRELRGKIDELSQRVLAIEVNLKPVEISELRRLFSNVSQRMDCLERKFHNENIDC